jgi:hypothetical protein
LNHSASLSDAYGPASGYFWMICFILAQITRSDELIPASGAVV